MKRSIRKIRKTIRSNKGEMLLESIVSLLILSILLVSVAVTIQTALRITGISLQEAQETQETRINPLVLAQYTDSEATNITFTAGGILASHQVVFNLDGGILAFSPPLNPDDTGVGGP